MNFIFVCTYLGWLNLTGKFNSVKAINDVETGVCGIVIPPTNTMFRYSMEACNILQTDDSWH